MSNRLPILAVEIRRAHANVQEAAKTAAEYAIAAGHALIEAKELVGHGEWLPWLKDNCALAERTAQLYMKLARSGHSASTVAALGLKAAEKALALKYCFHQPLHDGDDETRRTWWLFALFLAERLGFGAERAAEHIDWIGRHDFKTVHEWLVDGPKWAAAWGGRMSDLTSAFTEFRAKHDGEPIEDIEAALNAIVKDEPPANPKRRRRKTATVADFAGARHERRFRLVERSFGARAGADGHRRLHEPRRQRGPAPGRRRDR